MKWDIEHLPRFVRSLLAIGLVASFIVEVHLGNELAATALGPLSGSAVTYYFVKDVLAGGGP